MQPTEAALAAAYIKRTKSLRVARGFTQEQMAEALGIPLERYKKYEQRTPLPVYLVPRFSAVVNADVEHVVSGTTTKRRRGPRRPAVRMN